MPGDRPRFSVLVACYGHERLVEVAIRSIWAQTVGDFEIIAVDNGSPDHTGTVLERLAAESRVPMRVLHTVNMGADKAFNIAAAMATGAYLAFLNDDDEYAPDRLDAFSRVIDKSGPFSWGFSAVSCIDDSGAPLGNDSIPGSRRVAIELSSRPLEALENFHLVNTAVSSGNFVVRADLFHDLGGFRPYRYIHDWDLGLRLMMVAEPAILDRTLYRYRVHPSNTFNESAAEAEVRTMRISHQVEMAFDRDDITLVRPEDGSMPEAMRALESDERYALRAALLSLRMLHAIPLAYGLVRLTARGARAVFRLLRGR
jgi:glycosyltransferase involved in cell wall biosynthesis